MFGVDRKCVPIAMFSDQLLTITETERTENDITLGNSSSLFTKMALKEQHSQVIKDTDNTNICLYSIASKKGHCINP